MTFEGSAFEFGLARCQAETARLTAAMVVAEEGKAAWESSHDERVRERDAEYERAETLTTALAAAEAERDEWKETAQQRARVLGDVGAREQAAQKRVGELAEINDKQTEIVLDCYERIEKTEAERARLAAAMTSMREELLSVAASGGTIDDVYLRNFAGWIAAALAPPTTGSGVGDG